MSSSSSDSDSDTASEIRQETGYQRFCTTMHRHAERAWIAAHPDLGQTDLARRLDDFNFCLRSLIGGSVSAGASYACLCNAESTPIITVRYPPAYKLVLMDDIEDLLVDEYGFPTVGAFKIEDDHERKLIIVTLTRPPVAVVVDGYEPKQKEKPTHKPQAATEVEDEAEDEAKPRVQPWSDPPKKPKRTKTS